MAAILTLGSARALLPKEIPAPRHVVLVSGEPLLHSVRVPAEVVRLADRGLLPLDGARQIASGASRRGQRLEQLRIGLHRAASCCARAASRSGSSGEAASNARTCLST